MWPWDFNFHISSFQGCYERVMTWFDENKHVLGSIGMCILIMQVILVWCLSTWLCFAVSTLDSAVWKVVLNHFEFDHNFKIVIFVLWVHLRSSTQKGSRSVASPAKKTCYSGVLLTSILTSELHFGAPMFSHLLCCPLGNCFFKFWKQVLKIAKMRQFMATELSRLMCFKKEMQKYHHNLLRFWGSCITAVLLGDNTWIWCFQS